MANISHFTQTVNGVSTTYDIHDANAVPRSGGAVMAGGSLSRTVNDSQFDLHGGNGWGNGASISMHGKDDGGMLYMYATDGTYTSGFDLSPSGTATLYNNGTTKNLAMQEDTVPRSGGAVITGKRISKTTDNSEFSLDGGTGYQNGATIALFGKDSNQSGSFWLMTALSSTQWRRLIGSPDGTLTWNGQPIQTTSDQRLKQQITEIDDKLLDAWEDVELSQFKYNDAVDAKKDKARLHTGFVVQQIDSACKKHGVDISQYGLYCHEEYPERTEEVEVEQKDGTIKKETRVIEEASEHYSLRYTEVYAVECMYLRRCIARLTARIEELEKGNKAK